MRIAHLLCDDGITAELWLGALIDAGAPVETLQGPIDRAGLAARIVAERADAREVAATFVRFETSDGAERVDTPTAFKERIAAAQLPPRADERARDIADQLARAEAGAHGIPVDAVRFHEIGRPQGVARILASAAALEALNVDRVTVGPVALGGGTIRMSHGTFPVPAPAVLHLMDGFTIHGDGQAGELTTPSGAAVLAGLAEPVDAIPTMRLERHGRGALGVSDQQRLLTVLIGSGPGF